MNSETLNFFNGLALIFVLIYLAVFAVSLIMGILQIIATWKLYEKAGEDGWKAIIPVYNYFVMIKIATGKYTLGWVYLAISVLYIIFSMVSSLALEFSDGEVYAVMYVLVMLAAFVLMIPVWIIAGYVNYMFGKSYGKSTAWNVCMIFFAPILIIAMGFDSRTAYIGAKGIPQNPFLN